MLSNKVYIIYTNNQWIVLYVLSPHVSYFGFKFQVHMVNLEMQEILEDWGSKQGKEGRFSELATTAGNWSLILRGESIEHTLQSYSTWEQESWNIDTPTAISHWLNAASKKCSFTRAACSLLGFGFNTGSWQRGRVYEAVRLEGYEQGIKD